MGNGYNGGRHEGSPRPYFTRILPEINGNANFKQIFANKTLEMGRISKVKGAFDKGYIPNWSEEHFLVQSDKDNPERVFKLVDKAGEELQGSWYPEEFHELSKNRYLIEKVIRKRTTSEAVNELLVKWKGWPPKFLTWIPASDLERVT